VSLTNAWSRGIYQWAFGKPRFCYGCRYSNIPRLRSM